MLNQRDKTIEPETASASLTSQTYQRIHGMIIQGDLAPGLKLKIEDLRKTLGTGASPVREALSLLTSDQLVERIDQRGFIVSHVSVEAFQELLKTRCWVEELALRESIVEATPEWEEQLILLHHRLKRAPRGVAGADFDWETQHKKFHMALLSACGSELLLKFCDQLYDQNIRYRNISRPVTASKRNIADEHESILNHVLDGNADKAVGELIGHYQKTGKLLAEQIK